MKRQSLAIRAASTLAIAFGWTIAGCGPDPAEPFATATWTNDAAATPFRRLVTCADGMVMYVPVQMGDHVYEVRAGDWPVATISYDNRTLIAADAILEQASDEVQARRRALALLPDDDATRWTRVRLAWQILDEGALCGGVVSADELHAMLHLLGVSEDAMGIMVASTTLGDTTVRFVGIRFGGTWLYLDPLAILSIERLSDRVEEAASIGRADLGIDYQHPWRYETTDPSAVQRGVPRLSDRNSEIP